MTEKSTGLVKLDLGCGRGKEPGYLGVDMYAHPLVDIVYDLNKMPWPWESGSVDAIRFSRSLIHFEDIEAALSEVVRVLKPGGLLWIVSAHPSHPEVYTPNHRVPGFTLAGLATLTTIPRSSLYGEHQWQGGFIFVDVKLDVSSTMKFPWTVLARWLAKWRPQGYEQWFSWIAPIREFEWRARKRS